MRQPKPWFRVANHSWYIERAGRQHCLCPHPDATPPRRGKNGWSPPKEALDAFYKLMASEPTALPTSDRLLVCQVCDLFLSYAEAHCDARTFRWYMAYLQDFSKSYGRLRALELKPFHVTRWLDAHKGWKAGRRCAITAVKRAFSWADKEGVLSPSPIRSVARPPATRRMAVMSKEERREILANIADTEFRQFVEALQETGARPSEIARLTAGDVNLTTGICTLAKHKTSAKSGMPRVIFMTPRFMCIVKPLMKKYTTGPLFRGPRSGRPFGRQGICSRFRRLRQKLPHLKHAIAYGFRAAYATDALMNGVGIAQVAELLGHRDTTMVQKHYSLIREQTDYMREMARKATGA